MNSIEFSYLLVSSLHIVICLSPPSVSCSSASVLVSLCGASYIIIVLVSHANSARTSFLSFLSAGKNASNANLLVSRPDIVSAVMHAAGPGSEVTLIPAALHCFTSSSPGSDIPGVPASVITATSIPPKILSTRTFALSYLLNS